MGKFDGILFCTDLDGTLLRNDKTLSCENKDAIEFFKTEGGIFTFVTGRMPFFVDYAYRSVMPNAPIGCINGGGLYDYPAGEYIWTSRMPEEVMELVKCVEDAFPGVGIQVNTFRHTYFSRENPVMARFRELTGLPNLVCDYNDVHEPVAKVLFGSTDNAEILAIRDLLLAHPLSDRFDFIRSESTLFEILPKGISKGTSIVKLVEHLGLDANKTVAIGDYNNDIPMFRAAKLGVAVANACPEALAAADMVTVSNEEHAIARVIRDLYEGKIAL